MPWPVIWKKPIKAQAARRSSMIFSHSAELDTVRNGTMWTVGTQSEAERCSGFVRLCMVVGSYVF